MHEVDGSATPPPAKRGRIATPWYLIAIFMTMGAMAALAVVSIKRDRDELTSLMRVLNVRSEALRADLALGRVCDAASSRSHFRAIEALLTQVPFLARGRSIVRDPEFLAALEGTRHSAQRGLAVGSEACDVMSEQASELRDRCAECHDKFG